MDLSKAAKRGSHPPCARIHFWPKDAEEERKGLASSHHALFCDLPRGPLADQMIG